MMIKLLVPVIGAAMLTSACGSEPLRPMSSAEVGACRDSQQLHEPIPEHLLIGMIDSFRRVQSLELGTDEAGISNASVRFVDDPLEYVLPMPSPTAREIRAEMLAGSGDVVLGIGKNPVGEWRHHLAIFLRDDRALVAGHCAVRFTDRLARAASSRKVQPRRLVAAMVAGQTSARQAFEDADAQPAGVADWTARSPDERQFVGGETPADVLAAQRSTRIRIAIPPAWASMPFSICGRTAEAWGDCVALGATGGSGPLELDVLRRGNRGRAEVWLIEATSAPVQRIGRLFTVDDEQMAEESRIHEGNPAFVTEGELRQAAKEGRAMLTRP